MTKRPTYEELEQRVKDLEKEAVERKRAEEDLKNSEERLKILFEYAPDGYYLNDLKGTFIDGNKAAEEITGYKREQLIGKTFLKLKLLSPKQTLKAARLLAKNIQGKPTGPDEFILSRKDGTQVPVEISTFPVKIKGQILVLGIARDITARKRAEEVLGKRTHDLGERVKELNCLYDISKLVEKPGISLEKIVQGVVDLIPPSWQYPEITCARAILEGQEFRTKNFQETIWKQASDMTVHGERIGAIEICYLEERPESDEGPFLREERSLINAIAERLGKIIEHKQAGEALRESEERYRQLFQGISDAVMVYDSQGRFLDCNEATLKHLGYTHEEFLGLRPSDIVHPDFHPVMKENHKRIWAGEATVVELAHRCKDGRVTPVEVNARRIEYKGEWAILAVVRDLTERQLAEEERNELLKTIETTQESISIISPDLVILYTNDSMNKLFGYKKGELLGKHVSIVNAGPTPEAIAKEIANTIEEKGWWEGEVHNKRKDGTEFISHATTSAYKDKDGKTITFVLTQHDITEQKRAEEQLKESEEKYRTLVQNVPIAVYRTIPGLKGKYLMANPTFLKMFGLESEEEVKEITVADMYMNPEDRKAFSDNLLAKGSVDGVELPLKKKDGTPFWGSVTARVVYDEGGKALYFDCTIMDITARKRAEEEKEKLQAQLQRAQKMEAIGTLAGGVALDLKDILAGLVSYPELLLMGIPKRSPLRRPILAIQESGEKAAAIVQDLLTLARRGVAATEVVNLNDIVSEYLKSPEDERLKSFHPNVQFKTELETELLDILGSPAHLSKTVMNLLSNAAEATPYGGEIFISTENRYIDRPISGYDHIEEGDYVILAVSDTGEGISPEEMERIFEPFYAKKMMGRRCTGLGMTVVWGTVKDHNGYIDVKSSEGKGTTFTLYFPVSRKEVAKDQSLVSIEDYMGKGESVLVVDDVAEQREIVSRILKKLGYSVTAVSGGEEAVDYVKDNSADLLLLDMIMDPGIDGLETYKRILKYHPNQKAIIVSGFSETKRVKEAQGLGAGAYVKKPFLLQKIGLAVRDELDR